MVPENASLSPTERFWGMRALLGRLQLLHSLGEATLTRPAPPDPSRPHPTQGCAPGNRRAHQELTSATPSEAVFLSS